MFLKAEKSHIHQINFAQHLHLENFLFFFSGLKGTTVRHWIPQKQIVRWVPCRGTKNSFAEHWLGERRPEFVTKQWFLIWGEAQSHNTQMAMSTVAGISVTAVWHPHYNPYLATDFWAFLVLKCELHGQKTPHCMCLRSVWCFAERMSSLWRSLLWWGTCTKASLCLGCGIVSAFSFPNAACKQTDINTFFFIVFWWQNMILCVTRYFGD